MKKGKLIVIEGASDGMGKSTQMNLLTNRLINDGEVIVNHHFPTYGTYQGKAVEEYLKGTFGNLNNLSPYFIHLLYALDRAVTMQTTLQNEYNAGKFLLMDRYTTSSLLYQAANIKNLDDKKKFLDFVEDYEYNKLGIIKPSKVLFLYASFDLITELRSKRVDNDGIEKDIHETDLDFMKSVYDNAMFVANYLNWDMINCEENGKIRTIEDINDEVYKLVKKI